MARQESEAPPATLAAAQEQLYQRRLQRRQERLDQRLPVYTDDCGRLVIPLPCENRHTDEEEAPPHTESAPWQSAPARKSRKPAAGQAQSSFPIHRHPWESRHRERARPNPSIVTENRGNRDASLSEKRYFTIHPDLAVALLRNDLAAAGRIWLLLRHLDSEGRGWVSVEQARTLLTEKESSFRVCGWRQLRNLFAQGDDIFWQRDGAAGQDARIWLRSTAKVARRLGLARLCKRPVAVSLNILLEGVGTVRAHFFASFHSGREKDSPVARQTLEDLTGVSRRSQQLYEARAGVKKQQNWVVADPYAEDEVQHRAWQQGNAVFELRDHQGKSGPAGASYVAWQMPNSYVGPHTPQAPSRKKRINRQLAVLFNKGKTGNGKQKCERTSSANVNAMTRYFEHGRAAVRAYNRDAGNDLYWRTPASYGPYQVWHLLPAQKRRS